MKFVNTFVIVVLSFFQFGCANVNYYLGSGATLDAETTFSSHKPYSFADEAASGYFKFDDFEIQVRAHNTVSTEQNFELMFVTLDKQGPDTQGIGVSPFLIEVKVKGQAMTSEFYPFMSKFNGSLTPSDVKFRDPNPGCHVHNARWQVVEPELPVQIPDRTRNDDLKCYTEGWNEYLLEFDVDTPSPDSEFQISLHFRNQRSGASQNKTIYFKPIKLFSVQTH